MAPIPAPSDSNWREVLRRLDDLSARVEALERRECAALQPAADGPVAAPVFDAGVPAAAVVPLLGKALLGLAAAYLLRALVEMNTLPVAAGVPLGIAYALAWLAFASRATDPWAVKIRAVAATLMFLPLLWEAQMRFQALPSWATAGALVLFSVFGLAISWRKNLAAVAWVATLTGALAIFVLLIATRDMTPFLWALLGLAAAVEVSACLEHWLTERWLIAVCVDCAVILATWLYTQPHGLPEGYAPVSAAALIGAQIALLVLYLGSTIVRTLARGFRIVAFEILQCVAAFAIAANGTLRVAKGHPTAVAVLAAFCFMCGMACYVVAFVVHARREHDRRNLTVYSTFGLALMASAVALVGSGPAIALAYALFAVILSIICRTHTLARHVAGYLLLAGWAAGVFAAAPGEFLQQLRSAPPIDAAAVALTLAAAFCTWRAFGRREQYGWLRTALATTTALFAAAIAGSGLARVSAIDYVPLLLTGVLVLISAALVWSAGRFSTPELAWVGYAFLALATVKLVAQDLSAGRTLAQVGSLLLYGGALVLIPRLRSSHSHSRA